MDAHKIEAEFSIYWAKLTIVLKESILDVVKHIVEPAQASEVHAIIPDAQWALVMKEREAHYNGAKGYSWNEVKEMAHHKEKRDGL